MGLYSQISLGGLGREVFGRTVATFARVAKLTFGMMLASAVVFSTVSLAESRIATETYAQTLGLILGCFATAAAGTYIHRWAREARDRSKKLQLISLTPLEMADSLSAAEADATVSAWIDGAAKATLDPNGPRDSIRILFYQVVSSELFHLVAIKSKLKNRSRRKKPDFKDLYGETGGARNTRVLLIRCLALLGRREDAMAVIETSEIKYEEKRFALSDDEMLSMLPSLPERTLRDIDARVASYMEVLKKIYHKYQSEFKQLDAQEFLHGEECVPDEERVADQNFRA